MQNKPNLPKAQMNVNKVLTKDYENKTLGEHGKNKPNSKPIQTQSNPIKANKMPKQTQNKPNQTQFSDVRHPGKKSVQSARAPALREPKSAVKIKYMKAPFENSKLIVLFLASRPKFLVASAAPILVGSCLGYATAGSFNWGLFILALLAIMALHAGANMANDYFDHTSRNDWVNQNPTPFSGGRRYIQQGILSPRATLLTALFFLIAGAAIGIVIFVLTQSVFILILGLVGLLGGFFYTAPPVQFGYRCVGELVIAMLFGLLPVYGSYYLQTETIDTIPLLPAAIVGILIFLVILVNEFPDVAADAAVNKRTLVVRFGIPPAVWIYRAALIAGFLIAAAAMVIYPLCFFAGLFYLLTLPIAVLAIKFVNKRDLVKPGQYRASQITVLLHTLGSLALTLGFLFV
ncbi:1,4-dihydroxy-2-naphthoate octaprenyltransferase [subsurface metagenome]